MYPYYNPYAAQAQQVNNPYMTQTQQIVKVNGEGGARAYNMPANSSALLLDEVEPIIWLKQTDGAGYPTITPYKIEPYTKPEEPDYDSILRRIERLEDMINGKSYYADAQQTESAVKREGPGGNGKGKSTGRVRSDDVQ